MQSGYIILKFGNRRVVLRGTSGSGNDATYSQHVEGHVTIDFHSCAFVGSVIVDEAEPEPTLTALLEQIDQDYAPGYAPAYGEPASRYIGKTQNGLQLKVT